MLLVNNCSGCSPLAGFLNSNLLKGSFKEDDTQAGGFPVVKWRHDGSDAHRSVLASRRLPAVSCCSSGTTVPRDTTTRPPSLQDISKNSLLEAVATSRKCLQQLGTDPDDEVVHDLRVALRRLRNSMRLFSPYLDLPSSLSPRKISSLLRVLGAVRDADVMLESFATVKAAAEGEGGPREGELLRRMERRMRREQKRLMGEAVRVLRSKGSRHLLLAADEWVHAASFNHLTASLSLLPAHLLAAPLLAPSASRLLLHPAWCIPSVRHTAEAAGHGRKKSKSAAFFDPFDDERSNTMHDLRKRIRELRYEMEVLLPLYEGSGRYGKALGKLQRLQGVLGQLQDLHVLAIHLRGKGSHHGSQQQQQQQQQGEEGPMPAMMKAIDALLWEVWQKWLDSREIVNSPSGREKLYRALLNNTSRSELLNDGLLDEDDIVELPASVEAGKGWKKSKQSRMHLRVQ